MNKNYESNPAENFSYLNITSSLLSVPELLTQEII